MIAGNGRMARNWDTGVFDDSLPKRRPCTTMLDINAVELLASMKNVAAISGQASTKSRITSTETP